MKSVTEKH